MKKIWLSFLFFFLISYPQISLSSPQFESDFVKESTQEAFHRHLPQDLPQMRVNQNPHFMSVINVYQLLRFDSYLFVFVMFLHQKENAPL